jgi:hypothetical protein
MTDPEELAAELARPIYKANQVTPARRFANEAGQLIYSKCREGTTEDLTPDEADCFLVHAFAVVEASAVRAVLQEKG